MKSLAARPPCLPVACMRLRLLRRLSIISMRSGMRGRQQHLNGGGVGSGRLPAALDTKPSARCARPDAAGRCHACRRSAPPDSLRSSPTTARIRLGLWLSDPRYHTIPSQSLPYGSNHAARADSSESGPRPCTRRSSRAGVRRRVHECRGDAYRKPTAAGQGTYIS